MEREYDAIEPHEGLQKRDGERGVGCRNKKGQRKKGISIQQP